MTRTNIDIDDEACAKVMQRYQFPTKREAVNYALHRLVMDRPTVEEVRALQGIGWEGDLDEMRTSKIHDLGG